MYEVSTMAVEFMDRMLDHRPAMDGAVARINDGKAYFVAELERLGYEVLPTAGNFVHVAFGADGPGIHTALENRVLYRASFDHRSLAGFSRFSVAPQPIMSQVVEMIKKAAGNSL
jgi:histidinol-phosphate aminotransferase